MTSPSHLKSHSQLIGGNGSGRSVGSSAKIGLVGVLALIVLVVALWDKSDDPTSTESPSSPNAALASVGTSGALPPAPVAPAPVDPDPAQPQTEVIADAQDLPGALPPVAVPPAPSPRPSPAPQPAPRPTGSPTPAPAVAGTPYRTTVGDSLWKLAERFYGDGNKWRVIAEANNLGQSLPHSIDIVIPTLPNQPTPASARSVPGPVSADGFEMYDVKANDSLWKIAEAKLGSGARWPEIRDANRDVLLGANDDVVRVGMRLKIPRSS